MSDRYSVIFEGRLMPGKQMETVKQRLKSALKTDDQGIARLFTGSPVAIRKNTDQATAEKYRHVIAAAGACCDIRREGDNGHRRRPRIRRRRWGPPAGRQRPLRRNRLWRRSSLTLSRHSTEEK